MCICSIYWNFFYFVAVIVKIRGREYNSWKKNVPDSEGSRVVKYYGDFKFINNEIILQGSGKSEEKKYWIC